jgi:hypothetical protein
MGDCRFPILSAAASGIHQLLVPEPQLTCMRSPESFQCFFETNLILQNVPGRRHPQLTAPLALVERPEVDIRLPSHEPAPSLKMKLCDNDFINDKSYYSLVSRHS